MRLPRQVTPDWRQEKERGHLTLLRIMTRLSLLLGRPLTRPLVYAIALYFLAVATQPRRASRAYLQRVFPHPDWRHSYRHFMTFATTIHDRLYLLNDRFDDFDLNFHGLDCFDKGQGGLLFGSHLGSFELLRAVARLPSAPPVSVAMLPGHAARLEEVLRAINPDVMLDIIALGEMDAMLIIQQRIDQGHLVGMLADRASGADAYLTTDFLGAPAPFPSGPFRLAALLHCPVYFMSAVHQGGRRYAIHFSRLKEFSGPRQATMIHLMTQYVTELDHQCRANPYNWFNFYDFWIAPEMA